MHRRNIDRQVRRAIGERHAFLHRRIGVDHRRRDVLVVGLQRLLERLDGLVHRARLDEDLGRAAPDHHQPVGAARLLEVANVLAHLLGQVHLVLALLHVRAVELLHVVLVEDRLARLDRRQEGLHLLEQRAVEHAGFAGGRIHVVFEDVPAGKDQVVELRQGNKVVDLRRAAFGALAQADGAHLGQRTDGAGDSFANGFHAGDKGGRDGAHAGNHDAQLALGGSDFRLAGFIIALR